MDFGRITESNINRSLSLRLSKFSNVNVGKIGVLNKSNKRPKLDVFLRSEVRIPTKKSLKTPTTSSPCGRSGAFSYEKHTELIQAIQKTYDISYFFVHTTMDTRLNPG